MYAHLREIRMNQVVIRYANFDWASKILGSVQQRKFIRECLQWKGTFLGMSAYLKISAQPPPSCDFCVAHRYRKINKDRRAVSCESSEGYRFRIQRVVAPFRCLSFITEFVEDSFDAASGFSVLKNGSRRLSDFPGHSWGPGGWPGWFLRGFGVREARGGSFGVTKPKRDILVAI